MQPIAHTYVLSQALVSLGGDLWIEDEAGNRVFEVDGRALAIRRTLELRDPAGSVLYTISQSLAHLRRTFEVKQNDAVVATIEQALVSLFGDHFTIRLASGEELAVQGDWIGREFHVALGGADVIVASRSLLSLHGSYGVQVADGFDLPLALAIVVALEQMELEERRR